MFYCRHIPSPPLDEFVEYLWFYEGFFPDHSVERVLPDGAIELLIDLDGPPKKLYDSAAGPNFREFKRAWISGQHSGFIVIGTEQNSSMMGVHFRPGGAYPFVPFPICELNDDVVDLECVWGPVIRDIHARLLAAVTPEEKFRILEQTLWTISKGALTADPICRLALSQLRCAQEGLSIRALADHVGLSQRQLLRRFEERVGLGPKGLARVFRFQNVRQRLEKERRRPWADIALDAGYYDQSHFVRDFQQFTGLNPSRYLLDKRDYGNYIPIR